MIKKIFKFIFLSSLLFSFVAVSGFSFHQAFISRNYNVQIFTHHVTKEKTFVNGEKTIILLGTIHLGHEYYYENIKNDYKNGKFLALTEGLSDKDDLVKVNFEYSSIGNLVGLKMQPKGMFAREKNSDLDVRDLDKDFIKKTEALFAVITDIENITREKIESVPEVSSEVFERETTFKRNENLKKIITKELKTENNLVVPWGSHHLLDIEEFLISKGYKLKKTKYRPAINVPWALGYFLVKNKRELYFMIESL